MEFRTIVDIERSPFEIQPLERLLMVGSCFADNLGRRFSDEHFPVVVNPYGVMYNPVSILHTVTRFADGQANGSEPFVPATAVLTLGTNHVYIEKSTGEIVDNCRKRPQRLFEERALSIDECLDCLRQTVGKLRGINPDVNIIVTVSPIRYRKYGYHGSQLSKSVLLLAAEGLAAADGVYYFPSYEIMNDELRDYRFYQPDMLHPSAQAVEYMWERLVAACFSERAKEFLKEWKPVKEALGHRPFNADSPEYKDFMAKTKERMNGVMAKYGDL